MRLKLGLFYPSVSAYQFPFVKRCLANASGKRSGERIFSSRISSCVDHVSNDPFLHLFCSPLPPVPFGLRQRFCRYFGWRPTSVKKVIPAETGQDRPRSTENLEITWTGLVPLYNVCWPCLVTSFSHLPSGQGKREGSIIQWASVWYLVQIITIQAATVDHHGPLPYEDYPRIW